MTSPADPWGDRFDDEERALLAPFVTDLDALVAGGDPLIQPNRLAGRHRGQLTLDNQVVSFGGSGR